MSQRVWQTKSPHEKREVLSPEENGSKVSGLTCRGGISEGKTPVHRHLQNLSSLSLTHRMFKINKRKKEKTNV
jgi:hypothetical protein